MEKSHGGDFLSCISRALTKALPFWNSDFLGSIAGLGRLKASYVDV